MSIKFAVVAIKDHQADGFSPIYIERNVAIAIRNFSDACQQKDSVYNKHPSDYSLFLLGEYYPDTGVIKPYIYEKDGKIVEEAKIIATAKEFVATQEIIENGKKI